MNKNAKTAVAVALASVAGAAVHSEGAMAATATNLALVQCTLAFPASPSVVFSVYAYDSSGNPVTTGPFFGSTGSAKQGSDCGAALVTLQAAGYSCNGGSAAGTAGTATPTTTPPVPVMMSNGSGYAGPFFVCVGG